MFSKNKKKEFIYKSFTPPLPIINNYYRCDKIFNISIIESLYKKHETIGAIIILGESEQIYKIIGTKITKIQSNKLNRQKAQKKGGQSAPRIQRNQKAQVKHYINYICEQITNNFWNDETNSFNVKNILISGSNNLCKQVQLNLKNYPFLQPTQYIDNINDLYKWSKDAINTSNNNNISKKLENIFERMELLDPLIIYGKKEIEKNLYRCKNIYTIKKISKNDFEFTQYVIEQSVSMYKKLENIGGIIAEAYYIL